MDKHKAKRKERKERDHAEREAAREAGSEGGNDEKKDDPTSSSAGPPKPNLDTTSSPAPGSDGGPLSPRTDSTGARTPTSRKQSRHPWTLFIRLPNTTTEMELRDFFGEAKNGVRVRSKGNCALWLNINACRSRE